MALSRGRRGKRNLTLAKVISKLDESDEEVCDDSDTDTHTHTHTRLTALFPGLPR